MDLRAKHTFTWLKIFVPVNILELLILWVMSDTGSPVMIGVALALSFFGLIVGILINVLSKFRLTIVGYTAGHILAVLLSIGGTYLYLNGRSETTDDTATTEIQAPYSDTTTVISGMDKYAIEEVIFLMEQQYPFGVYDIVDVQTEHKSGDSTTIYSTIVFTLKEEGNKKYISQYIVKNGSVEPVYTRQDTTSVEYQAYKTKSATR